MWSYIELNDTLQITTEQWFPTELKLEIHKKNPYTIEQFEWKIFEFKNKAKIRIFHPAPTRVFLVHNIDWKRLYRGHCQILEQTIHSETNTTSGKFKIIKIYNPEHQKNMSIQEVSIWKSYFQ